MWAVKRGSQQWMTGNMFPEIVLLSSAPFRLASTQLPASLFWQWSRCLWRLCQGTSSGACGPGCLCTNHTPLLNNTVMASGFSIRAASEVCVSLCVLYCLDCLVAQSCPTLCDPMDCSSPGSSVRGISQARILEWVVISFSRGSSWPRDQTRVSCTGKWVLLLLSHWGSTIA